MVFQFKRVLQYIKKHQNAKAQSVLEQANDPYNLVDASGNSLLHYAAKYDNISMTKYLLNHGTLVDVQNKDGETPLLVALKHCDPALLPLTPLLLIEAKADINILDKTGNSPLEESIVRFTNNNELWEKMLKKVELQFSFNYHEIANLFVKHGCMLQDVMYVGCSEVTKVMLESGGYDVNNMDDIGRGALHGAVSFSHLGNVKLLVEHGADVNLLDSTGSAPVAYLSVGHRNVNETLEILRIFMDSGAKMFIPEKTNGAKMQFSKLLEEGNRKIIRLIMKYEIDFETRDDLGMTALHMLAKNNNLGVFDELRNKTFNVNVLSDCNYTPIEFALENPSSIRFLLEHGAKVDPDSCGIAIVAVIENFSDELLLSDKFYADIIVLLLQYGADVDIITPDGLTIFDAAIDYDRFALIKPVLAHLALKKVAGKLLSKVSIQQINAHKKFKDRFDRYEQEVERMKTINVYKCITLYSLLTENEEEIAVYMRNKKLVLKLARLSNKCGLTSYYRQCLRKKLTEAIRIARLKEGAAIVLCNMIEQLSNTDGIIIDKIINFIGLEDLKQLYYVY